MGQVESKSQSHGAYFIIIMYYQDPNLCLGAHRGALFRVMYSNLIQGLVPMLCACSGP